MRYEIQPMGAGKDMTGRASPKWFSILRDGEQIRLFGSLAGAQDYGWAQALSWAGRGTLARRTHFPRRIEVR